MNTDTMKILVINASANKERSTTLKLTRTFLEGLGAEASEVEIVTTIGLNINPCRACYACWFKTNGKCVQKDELKRTLEGMEIEYYKPAIKCIRKRILNGRYQ